MTVFMKQYGRTIVCVIFAAAVFGIAFGVRLQEGTGFVQAAYQKAEKDRTNRDVTAYTDADALKAVIARKKPEIIFQYQKIIPGISVNINRLFSALDEEENPVDIEIMDVLDTLGESILFLTEKDRKQKKYACDPAKFVFSQTGVYTIKVRAADKEKRTSDREYKVPVTSR